MIRTPVVSSTIASIGYNPETHDLEVEFRSGGVYTYGGVPAPIHTAFMAAESKGRYFATEIRDRYLFVKSPVLPVAPAPEGSADVR